MKHTLLTVGILAGLMLSGGCATERQPVTLIEPSYIAVRADSAGSAELNAIEQPGLARLDRQANPPAN